MEHTPSEENLCRHNHRSYTSNNKFEQSSYRHRFRGGRAIGGILVGGRTGPPGPDH
jgi:hypothetical protein